MYEPKPLSKEAIPAALAKAERYRLLNEGEMAESICEDVLSTEPVNQQALVTMILAVTDQFRDHGVSGNVSRALTLVPRIEDEYERLYYEGIVYERRARAHLAQSGPGGGFLAYDWLSAALRVFELAMAKRPVGNDDAVLRWNACARTLMRHPELEARGVQPEAVIESE
ncbi:MAG: hypothetical protein GEU99_12160 [Luteitalea sp.]|nr:hypothetical protein [Luteitalea sp.]